MSAAVSVRADHAKGPGYALILVPGAAACADPRFRVWRSPDWPACNLGPSGWQGSEAMLAPEHSRPDGNDLVLSVGPAVCDVLEPDNYYFALPATGLSTSLAWPDEIEPLHSIGVPAPFQPQSQTRTQPAPPPARAEAEIAKPPPDPMPPTPPVDGGAYRLPEGEPDGPNYAVIFGLAGLLVVLALAAAAVVVRPWTMPWWPWRIETAQLPAPAPSPPQPAPTPTPTPTPITPPSPAPTPDPTPPAAADPDRMSVTELAAGGDPAVMLAQAQKRMATKPQEALLLLEVAGSDRHHGPALSALGRLYDPALPRQGGIPADTRQAAKAYQDAAKNHDDSAAAEREALHQKLIQQRDAGDVNAKLILQDFWP